MRRAAMEKCVAVHFITIEQLADRIFDHLYREVSKRGFHQ
jgi:hypothetical protein